MNITRALPPLPPREMRTLRFQMEPKDRREIIKALKVSQLHNGLDTYPEALLKICQDYLNSFDKIESDAQKE